jgi:hypothetical protein
LARKKSTIADGRPSEGPHPPLFGDIPVMYKSTSCCSLSPGG